MTAVIEKVLRSGTCAGCGACESICGASTIHVKIDEAGFFRPKVLAPISDQDNLLLSKVCPGVTVAHLPGDGDCDSVWGPVLAIKTGYATDAAIRYQGSSGGVLTALQVHLLESNLVDAVVNVGAAADQPLRNDVYISRNSDEIIGRAGSRYAPSSPLREIHSLLDGVQRVAFVGKPCDVSAMRRLATFDPRLKGKEFCYLSFLCAGVPSQNATTSLVKALGVNPEEVVKFRYRGEGWPGYAKAETRDGRTAKMSYNDSWGKILNRHLQTRCKICPDGTGEFADISCGDAWRGDEKGFPDFKELDGRSAILVRTLRGKDLIRSALDAGHIEVEKRQFSLDNLSRVQPYQVNRRRALMPRTVAFFLFKRERVSFTFNSALAALKQGGLLGAFREFVGTVKRLILNKL